MSNEGAHDRVHPPEGIAALIGDTIGDGKRWARAEVGYYKAVAGERAGDAGVGTGLAIGAAVLAQAALVVGLVGVLLYLAPRIGTGWATVIVVLATLAIAGTLGGMALSRFRRVRAPLPKGERS